MTDHPAEAPPVLSRNILHLHPDDDDDETLILIDHVYEREGATACECGGPSHDPGMVWLSIADEDGDGSAFLTAEQALLVANRLTRAASLVLESGEDVPDVEREAARYQRAAVPDGDGPA
jgi:hypothetical protein